MKLTDLMRWEYGPQLGYSTLRLHVFAAHCLFSESITVFGPFMIMFYREQNYLAFRDSESIKLMTHDFDTLVRGASIAPRSFHSYIQTLMAKYL